MKSLGMKKEMMRKTTKSALNKYLKFAMEVAFEAGDVLIRYHHKRDKLKVFDKGAEGIASEADEKSEKLITQKIRKAFPGHTILAEEDFSKNKREFSQFMSEDMCWHIDPLDGTSNFVNGLPIYAVSIALVEKGMPIVGVVYNPLTGEMFRATKGGGAFYSNGMGTNGRAKKLTKILNQKKMQDCIFSPSPAYEIDHQFERQLSVFRKNIIGARAVRRLGSAAIELCYVANGSFDGYWERRLKPWDLAAAGLICIEAGVAITDFEGGKFHPFITSVLAAYNPLHQKILGKI